MFKQIVIVGFAVGSFALVPATAALARPQTAPAASAAVDDSALQSQIAASLKKNTTLAPRNIDVDVSHAVVTLTGTVRTSAEKTKAGQLATVAGVTRVENQITVDPKLDQSKIDAAGEKTKTGVDKAVDATATAAKKTKSAVQKGAGKTEHGVAKAADKTADALGAGSEKLDDASLTTRVKGAFSDDKSLTGSAIDVSTTDQVVTLKGTVPSSAAKARAGVVASGVKGVTRVVNDIEVSK